MPPENEPVREAPPAETGPASPRKAVVVAGTLALLCGALVVSLFLAEVAVRLLAPQQLILIEPGVWLPQDTVGYTFRPRLRRTINTGERTVTLVTDEHGFRVGMSGAAEGDRAILLMGDSFLAALQVEYEASLPGLMDASGLGGSGSRTVVRNAAVPGWDPAQYYYRTRQLLGEATFEAVVVGVYLGNDVVYRAPAPIAPIEPVTVHRFRMPQSLSRAEFTDAMLRPVNDFLETHSHLFVFAKARLKTLLMRFGLAPEYFPVEFRRSEAASSRWNVAADILSDVATEAERYELPTVFVLIPTPYQVDEAVFDQYVAGFDIDPDSVDLDQPTTRLASALEARGRLVVDALPRFRQLHDEGVPLYGRVDRHLTAAGHEALWSILRPSLDSLLEATTR